MIKVSRRLVNPNPVPSDTFKLGQTRNHLHVSRSRANMGGIGDYNQANWAEQFAKRESVPQMINRAKNALSVNPFMIGTYFKVRGGRRCSCWGKGETPDGYCVSCYQAGYVGGYEKNKCSTELIDSTHPDLSLVNVMPDVKSGRVPIPLSLTSKAVKGAIEVVVKLAPNVGILDLFKVHSHAPNKTKMDILVRKSSESLWSVATFDNVQRRLQSGVILFRIELHRETVDVDPPYLKAIRLRYQVQKGDTRIPMNIPIGEESFQLQDLGIWQSFSTLQFFTDNTLKSIRNEDMLYNPRDGRRFKVINTKLFAPSNTIVSWLISARFAQEFDAISKFEL